MHPESASRCRLDWVVDIVAGRTVAFIMADDKGRQGGASHFLPFLLSVVYLLLVCFASMVVLFVLGRSPRPWNLEHAVCYDS